jgi:hypothetical protein
MKEAANCGGLTEEANFRAPRFAKVCRGRALRPSLRRKSFRPSRHSPGSPCDCKSGRTRSYTSPRTVSVSGSNVAPGRVNLRMLDMAVRIGGAALNSKGASDHRGRQLRRRPIADTCLHWRGCPAGTMGRFAPCLRQAFLPKPRLHQ